MFTGGTKTQNRRFSSKLKFPRHERGDGRGSPFSIGASDKHGDDASVGWLPGVRPGRRSLASIEGLVQHPRGAPRNQAGAPFFYLTKGWR